MKLFKNLIFKNFKSKKQFREENSKLKQQLSVICKPVINVEKIELQKICASLSLSYEELINPPSDEWIKGHLAHMLAKEVSNYMALSVEDRAEGFKKEYRAIIRVEVPNE